MTSKYGKKVDDGKNKSYNIGFVIATHGEDSCISTSEYESLYIPIRTNANAKLVELSPNGDNGRFATPNGLTITYDDADKYISHWSIPRD